MVNKAMNDFTLILSNHKSMGLESQLSQSKDLNDQNASMSAMLLKSVNANPLGGGYRSNLHISNQAIMTQSNKVESQAEENDAGPENKMVFKEVYDQKFEFNESYEQESSSVPSSNNSIAIESAKSDD